MVSALVNGLGSRLWLMVMFNGQGVVNGYGKWLGLSLMLNAYGKWLGLWLMLNGYV